MKTIFLIVIISCLFFSLEAQNDCNAPLLAGSTTGLEYHLLNSTLNGSSFDSLMIDLDEDGINDILFMAVYEHFGMYTNSSTTVKLENAEIEIMQDTVLPENMETGDSISICKYWVNSPYNMYLSGIIIEPGYIITGNWYSQMSGFLGFRIIKTADTLYGWVSLQSIVNEMGCMLSVIGYAIQEETASVHESDLNNEISIFPNPASDVLNINVTGNSPPIMLIVTNSTGKKIIRKSISHSISLPVVNWPSGIYSIEFLKENTRFFRKFIKQ